MPTYQYVCGQCNAPLEVVQSFSDDALTTCPECKAEALKKVYGSVGVVFKGSGFYRNDSRGTTTSATPSSTESGSTSSGSSGSGSAATPASTPAPAAAPAPASTPSPSA